MFTQILTLLGGISLFLFGMKLMSEGAKSLSGQKFKSLLTGCTKNQFSSFVLGLLVTSVIQSSTASIVLIAGLCDGKMMNAESARGCVIGAAVGTTATGQILRLAEIGGSFGIEVLAPAAAVIGTVFLLSKSFGAKNTGTVLMGLSVLFFALMHMKQSMDLLCKTDLFFSAVKSGAESSCPGLIAGVILTVLCSSCSASVGILQTLCMSAEISFAFAAAFVIGAVLGTVVPIAAVFASCKKETKTLFAVYCLYACLTSVITAAFAAVFPDIYSFSPLQMSAGAVADFQTVSRLISSAVFLPLLLCFGKKNRSPERAGIKSPTAQKKTRQAGL